MTRKPFLASTLRRLRPRFGSSIAHPATDDPLETRPSAHTLAPDRRMTYENPHLDKLLELDQRHTELLDELDTLDRRVADVLAQFRPSDAPAQQASATAALPEPPGG
jgi:hypothetical protein